MGKFVISKRINGDYQFVLQADNGEVILNSQGYAFKSSCENGINSVQKNAEKDYHFERKNSYDGKYFFNIKAGNGQVVGSSEMYESPDGCEKGILSVKNHAPNAEIIDSSRS